MVLDKTIPNIGKFTKVPLNLFFVIGVVILRWEPNEKPKLLHCIFITIVVFNFILDVGGMALYLHFESLETTMEKTAYVIFCTFGCNFIVKYFYCIYNTKRIRHVLKKFNDYYPKTIQERQDYKLDEHLKSINRYNLGLTIYHFGVTSLFNLFPLLQTIILYYQSEDKVFLYELPFPLVYVFNTKNAIGYTFAYITQCAGSYTCSCGFLGYDLLLITCVHIINMKFKYLAKIIGDFKPTGSLRDLKELKKFINFHNHILDSVKLVDQIFNVAVFLNYLATVTMICLIGFQLVVGTNFLDLIKYLSFLISALAHVFFISIFATKMMTLSSEISEAFMHHAWYEGHLQYQRAMVMSIGRAQKPVHLNAFKFFIISMETFKSLVSISYQFFTLIKTSYEEQ